MNIFIIKAYNFLTNNYKYPVLLAYLFSDSRPYSHGKLIQKNIFSMIKGNKAVEINLQYHVEKGYNIYSILSEDNIEQFFIAKDFEYII